MNKLFIYMLVVISILIGGFFWLNRYIYNEKQGEAGAQKSYKDIAYTLEGQPVQLAGGFAETEAVPGSASKIMTRYFGNELKTDLNGDGREDIVFLLTQQTGGSGTFYYVVAALDTGQGYAGSDGYLLGDRIAPQTTGVSQNPRHKNVVVVNYAGRAPGEPMTAQPSVGKSAYLKLDTASMRWAIVEPDFEGESAGTGSLIAKGSITGIAMVGPMCPVATDPPDPQCADKPYKTSLVVTTADQVRVIKAVETDERGRFSVDLPPGTYAIRSAAAANILPYCASNGVITVIQDRVTETIILCDTGIR